MHVLLMDTATGPAREAAHALEEAGHVVHRCHNPDDRGTACAILRHETCPLEVEPIDAAVTVRTAALPRATVTEDGIRCAAGRHVPVVVAGTVAQQPFRPWTTVECRVDDVVAGVANAVAMPLPLHSGTATTVARAALAAAGHPRPFARVEVHRRDARLRVRLVADPAPPKDASFAAAVRVAGALRRLDPWADAIDVQVPRVAPTASA